ncbi:MAG: ABC transporter transmembrane domain-containing protein [Helicobacteraceae bacterium]|nr:ABC transporter transmembrane domain-containing protein [Helicobacteraceae bacterium]
MEIFKRYWPYTKEYKFHYILIFIGIVLTVSATVATAQIMQPLMDDMFIKKDTSMLYLIPMMLIIIYVVKAVGRYIQSVFMTYVGLHIISRFREILLEKILYFDMEFIFMNRSGELISRLTNDLNRIQYFVSNMLPELIRESLTVLALIGYVIYLNPELAFYSLVVVPLVFYPIIAIAKKLKKYSHRSQAKNADVVVRLTEVFNNSEIIKANATEAYEMERFSTENWKFFKINMKATYVGQLISPIMELVGAVGLASVIFMGGKYVYNGHMSVGEFTAFLTAVGLVFQPIRRIGSIYSKIQDAIAASERVFDIIDRENSIIDGDNVIDGAIKQIDIEEVDLFYGDKQVLDNINLSIHEGQNIALVGDSGGGKSSLVNLLVRFYDASQGIVRVNGLDIKAYKQQALRDKIAIVSQRVYIMQDTLAQNVAYGHEVDEEKVIEALKHADAYDFVQALPSGIHTIMEEFGSNLSGGQRQRIAIARAIYKNASLLILDEATSALDNESEKRIQKALEAYTKDKITITIAHRLSTIEDADLILVFQAGKIVDRGTHQELLKSSPVYQRLSGELTL